MKKADKVEELINSLINLTKHTQLKWDVVTDYLDKNLNERLKHYMISNNEYYDVYDHLNPYLSESNSYCTKFDSGLIYLLSYYNRRKKSNYYIIGVQNSNYGEIIELNTENMYQEDIYKLQYHVKDSVDNIDLFVDTIITKGKKYSD